MAALLGDQAAAEGHFGRALERCAMLGAGPAQARIQCHYGESLIGRDGQQARAVELLAQSLATARELAMGGLAERAGQALARLEASPERGVGAPP